MDAIVKFDFAVAGVSRFLSISGLAKLEVTTQFARSVVLNGGAWFECASRELPLFDLVRQLDEPMRRVNLKEMIAILKIVAVVGVARVPLVLPSGVGDLLRAVRRAEHRMSSHVAQGVSAGQVLLARFFFEPNEVRAMLAPAVCACPGGVERGTIGSAPVTIFAPSRAHDVEIDVKLMLQSDAVFLNATTDAHETFVVDVHAVSPALLLQMRGARIRTGSHRSKGCGLVSIRGSRTDAVDALASGLLCVISIRGAGADADFEVSQGVHALHLDALRPVIA